MVQWYHVRFACERPRVRTPIYPFFNKKLRFYTYIIRNIDILKNLKIINNDKIKITLNKKEINEEIIKKYKDLLGNKGYKEYYFDINDKVINITTEEIMDVKMQLEIKQQVGI